MKRLRTLNLIVVVLLLIMGGLRVGTNTAFADEPANDDPSQAIVVSSLPYHTTQDTTQAAVSLDPTLAPVPSNGHNYNPDPAAISCINAAPNDPTSPGGYSNPVWYSWTATFTGAITVDTIGSGPRGTQVSDYDQFHDVFTNTSTPGVGTWNEVSNACSDDIVLGSPFSDSRSTFLVTKSTTYYVMVATDGSGTGGVNPPPPAGTAALNIYPHDLEFNTNAVNFATTEGQTMPSTLIGSFTDTDGASCGSFVLSVNWGDGITEDNVPCLGAQNTAAGVAGINLGGVNSVSVTDGGSGYSGASPPTVTFSGGGGSGATAHVDPAKIVNGTIVPGLASVVIDTPGTGYTSAPTVTFGPPTIAPDVTISCTNGGGVTDCQITGKHIYAEETAPNPPYQISVTVSDKADGTTASSSAPSTTATQDAPVTNLSNAQNQTTTQGMPTSVFLGTFHDANPLCPSTGPGNDYTAATGTVGGIPHSIYVDWGDGTNTGNPADISVVPIAGTCNFGVYAMHTYAAGAPGTNTVAATLTDNGSSVAFTTTVYLPNLGTPTNGSFSVVEGQSFQGQLLGTFVDTNLLCNQDDYSVSIDWKDTTTSNIPAPTNGAVLGLGHCTFGVYAPAHTYAEETTSPLTLDVVVTHGSSSVTIHPAITVTDAAISGAAGGIQIKDQGTLANPIENTAFTGSVGTFTDADPNCVPADYTATVNWGDGTTDTAATFSFAPGTCVIQVSDTHTYKTTNASGYAVVTTVVDHNSTTQIASTAIVADAPLDAPTGNTFPATEGTPFSGQLLGSFHDTDPACDAKNYTASITWGDGKTSTATASNGGIVLTSGCVFQVFGGHEYTSEGALPYTVTVNDSGGSSTSWTGTTTVTIADAAISVLEQNNTLTSTEGSAIPGLPSQAGYLGTFHDADPNCNVKDFTATVDWGTGSGSTTSLDWLNNGIVDTRAGTCDFKLYGTYTYTTHGTYPIVVTVNDAGAPAITLSDTAKISDAALTATGIPGSWQVVDPVSSQLVTPVEGQTYTDQLLGTVTDADPNCDPNNLTVAINWGDGTGSDTTSGKVSQHPGSCVFDVLGSHAFSEETTQPFQIVAKVSDNGGSSAPLVDSTRVTDAPLSSTANSFGALPGTAVNPPVHEGAPFTAQLVGTITDADPNCNYHDYTVVIEWGDSPYADRSTGFLQPSTNPAAAPCTFDVFGNHTFPEEGSYVLTVTTTDAGGSTTISQPTATVNDALLTPIPVKVTATEGKPFPPDAKTGLPLIGTFHDADPGCALTDYTLVSITWGDGTGIDTTTGSIVPSADGKACDFDVLGKHTYIGVIPSGEIVSTVHDTTGPINDTTITIHSPLNVGPSVLTLVKYTPLVSVAGLEGQTLSSQNGNVKVFLGSFTDATPACNHTYAVSIEWGDGVSGANPDTTTGTAVPSTHVGTFCTFDVYGDHTYAEENAAYVIHATVSDVGGASVDVPTSARITDSPLVALANLVPNTCTLLTSCDMSAPGMKPLAIIRDLSTTCTTEGDVKPHYTVTIKWGDNKATDKTGVITPAGSPCVFNVYGVHTYTKPGKYIVITTMTDEGGSTVTTSLDPNAPNTETASTVKVVIPPTTKHVGNTPAQITALYTHTVPVVAHPPLTDYAIDLSVMQYQNGTFTGHLNFLDKLQNQPVGLTIPNCQITGNYACKLTILSFITGYGPGGAPSKVGTIFAKYIAPGSTRYVRIDVTDPDPSTGDTIHITMGGPTNDTVPVYSSPPTAPTGAVTVVVS